MSKLVVIGWFALACMGCGRGQAKSIAPPVERGSPAALCLQAPQGAAAADEHLRAAQKRARGQTAPGPFVDAGHAWVRKARSEFRPALYLNADGCAQAVLERHPRDGAALGLRGLVLLDGHRFAQARDLARAVLARDPSDLMAWGVLSDAQLELGELDAAMDAAQRLLDLKPSLAAYGRAAHLRFLQGDVLGAKQLYAQAIAAGRRQRDREPSAWMLVQAALLFLHQGDHAGADAGFDLALSELPAYAPALEGKGRVALARGAPKEAARWLARALAKRPVAETAWLLGEAHTRAGDVRAAEQARARALQMDPGFDAGHRGHGHTHEHGHGRDQR